MAFTYDATTDRGRVRLIIGDTSSGDYKFEDGEIDAFLAMTQTDAGGNNVARAAAAALRAWAADLARETASVKTAEFARDNRHRAEQMIRAAEALERSEVERPYGGDAEVAQTDYVAGWIQANKDLRES